MRCLCLAPRIARTTKAPFAGTGVVPHAAVYDDDPV
jgi:hypothetical protein